MLPQEMLAEHHMKLAEAMARRRNLDMWRMCHRMMHPGCHRRKIGHRKHTAAGWDNSIVPPMVLFTDRMREIVESDSELRLRHFA